MGSTTVDPIPPRDTESCNYSLFLGDGDGRSPRHEEDRCAVRPGTGLSLCGVRTRIDSRCPGARATTLGCRSIGRDVRGGTDVGARDHGVGMPTHGDRPSDIAPDGVSAPRTDARSDSRDIPRDVDRAVRPGHSLLRTRRDALADLAQYRVRRPQPECPVLLTALGRVADASAGNRRLANERDRGRPGRSSRLRTWTDQNRKRQKRRQHETHLLVHAVPLLRLEPTITVAMV